MDQHGFVRDMSNITNLTFFSNYFINGDSRGQQVDVTFTNFSKAYTRVQYNILLEKQKVFGFNSNLPRADVIHKRKTAGH